MQVYNLNVHVFCFLSKYMHLLLLFFFIHAGLVFLF